MTASALQVRDSVFVLCARSWLVVCEQEGAAAMVRQMHADLRGFHATQSSPRPTDPALVYWLERLLAGAPEPVQVACTLFDFLVPLPEPEPAPAPVPVPVPVSVLEFDDLPEAQHDFLLLRAGFHHESMYAVMDRPIFFPRGSLIAHPAGPGSSQVVLDGLVSWSCSF